MKSRSDDDFSFASQLVQSFISQSQTEEEKLLLQGMNRSSIMITLAWHLDFTYMHCSKAADVKSHILIFNVNPVHI